MKIKETRKNAIKRKGKLKWLLLAYIAVFFIIAVTGCSVLAPEDSPTDVDDVEIGEAGEREVDEDAGPLAQLLGSRSQSLQIVGLLTILSLAPAILIMVTGFTRIVIVLSFTRNALGLQQMPPNQVIVALALFLTFFVMHPVLTEVDEQALQPYINEEISFDEAVDRAEVPLKSFMLRQTGKSELSMFMGITEQELPETDEGKLDIPISTVIPAFIISEIKRAFMMGFLIYIPFIVIDMVVASTLMAMGMMMLPPVTISLPFKVMLFILVDGWALTVQSLITGFG